MRITLKIWRQAGPDEKGRLVTFKMDDVDEEMSFLEMLDVLNQDLILDGKLPVAFEHDCREGICGSCGFVIDGYPHGPQKGTTLCQLYMRQFKDGQEIVIEPFRVRPFAPMKDLIVDRSALDRIIQAGGYIAVNTGNAPDGNAIPVPKDLAETAMDYAECIGCGACVAACPNSSAMLFVSAKIAHLGILPQGEPERERRAKAMIQAMDEEDFGACSNYTSCEAVCPKEISISAIAKANRFFRQAFVPGLRVGGGKKE